MIERSSIRERVMEDDDNEPLRAAVYARTSSKSGGFGYSLDAQAERGVKRCESLGWTVIFVYRDEAESGKDTDRPMFQQMLNMAEKRTFDVIVFWKLDRFSRSLMHAVQLESELRESDVYLYSVTEQIDTTTATGRFNFRNIASAAEFERDMIKQRTKIGLQGLAKEHRWPNNNPPFGYNLSSDNRLEINEREAKLVIEIFESYIEQRSMPNVASELDRRGILSAGDGNWTPRAIGEILRNKIYVGTYELGEVSDFIPEYQIIDKDVFENATRVRMRFQEQKSPREAMPESRKEKAVLRMKTQYRSYLNV